MWVASCNAWQETWMSCAFCQAWLLNAKEECKIKPKAKEASSRYVQELHYDSCLFSGSRTLLTPTQRLKKDLMAF